MEVQTFTDVNGVKYTNESLLRGIAAHTQFNYIGGGLGDRPFDNIPLGASPEVKAWLDAVYANISTFTKYSDGTYLTEANLRANIKNKTLSESKLRNVPAEFMNTIRKVSSETGVPAIHYVLVTLTEGGFSNAQTNGSGYSGYFGQGGKGGGAGAESSLEEQAKSSVTQNYQRAQKCSPGANQIELLALASMFHHLPAIYANYWEVTNHNIWITNGDYMWEKLKQCDAKLSTNWFTKQTRIAEDMLYNLTSQYKALQMKQYPSFLT